MATPDSGHAIELPCLAIGADAGGTKIAIWWSDGLHTHRHEAASKNLRTSTPAEFAAHVAGLIKQALNGVLLHTGVRICMGAAGAGTPKIAQALRAELSQALSIPEHQIRVVADAHIAIKAGFPGGDGVLVIAGTGSGCYALDPDGRLIRAGGWGPGLEDPGSGNELGRSAVKHLLSKLESGTMDTLSQCIADAMILRHPSVSDVLDAFYRPDYRASTLAPAIMDLFESGDPQAHALVENQCADLASQCQRLILSLEDGFEARVAVAGGLANRESYLRALTRAVQQVVPEADVARLERAPVEGALEWARSEQNSPGLS